MNRDQVDLLISALRGRLVRVADARRPGRRKRPLEADRRAVHVHGSWNVLEQRLGSSQRSRIPTREMKIRHLTQECDDGPGEVPGGPRYAKSPPAERFTSKLLSGLRFGSPRSSFWATCGKELLGRSANGRPCLRRRAERGRRRCSVAPGGAPHGRAVGPKLGHVVPTPIGQPRPRKPVVPDLGKDGVHRLRLLRDDQDRVVAFVAHWRSYSGEDVEPVRRSDPRDDVQAQVAFVTPETSASSTTVTAPGMPTTPLSSLHV